MACCRCEHDTQVNLCEIVEIVKALNDRDGSGYGTILEFCKTPKAPQEIIDAFAVKRGKYSLLGNEVFTALLELKNKDAIGFNNGKYFTTQLGLEALASI